jgi:SRR1
MPHDVEEDEEESWTTVLATDKKRVMRKRGMRRRPPTAHEITPKNEPSLDGCIQGDLLHECLRECMDYLLKTEIWRNLAESVDSSLASVMGGDIEFSPTSKRRRQVVAFGIGNFSKTTATYYSAPLWQLAIATCLRDHWMAMAGACDGAVSLVFFDPCSTNEEISFLKERLNCDVLESNEKGNHPVGNAITLFFMPHCPAQLYEHVVWSNFDSEHCVLYVGNSFSRLAQKAGEGKVYPCIQALLPWLHETSINVRKADWKEAPGNLHGAVNDTYVSHFNKLSKDKCRRWPKRPYGAWSADNTDDPELL